MMCIKPAPISRSPFSTLLSSPYVEEEGKFGRILITAASSNDSLEYKASEHSYFMDPWLRNHFGKVITQGNLGKKISLP